MNLKKELRIHDTNVSRRKKKPNSENLIASVLTLLAFLYYFVPGAQFGLSPTFFGRLRNLIAVCFFFYSLKNVTYFFRGKYVLFNLALLVYCIVQILSVALNIDTVSSLSATVVSGGEYLDISGADSARAVIFNCMMYLGTALQFEYWSNRRKSFQIIKVLFFAFAALTFIADFNAVFIVDRNNPSARLIGDKFTLSYLNLFLCSIYHLVHPHLRGRSKMILIGLVLCAMFIAYYVECTTAMLGGIVYGLLVLLVPLKGWKRLKSPWILILTTVVLDIGFFFFSTLFMENDFVRFIVEDILNEDSTLTGRLRIYSEIRQAFVDSPWLGFGQGNSFVVSYLYADAPDVQNGLMDLFLQTGLLGCIAFLFYLYAAFRQIETEYWHIFPILALIYTMVVISMVEIPFNAHFVFFVMLLLLKRPKILKKRIVANVRS